MEQFFVVIAIVIFWIFRQASAGARRGRPGASPFDILTGGESDEPNDGAALRSRSADANLRALEALQRWEARQRAGEARREDAKAASRTSPTRREPPPTPPRGRPPRVTIARGAAERERKRLQADIASMLDPAGTPRFRARPRVERSRREPAPLVEQSSPAEAAVRQPTLESAEAPRARLKQPAGRAPRKSAPEAALARLERLPLAARAIVYGEILGRPKAFD